MLVRGRQKYPLQRVHPADMEEKHALKVQRAHSCGMFIGKTRKGERKEMWRRCYSEILQVVMGRGRIDVDRAERSV
jgi:hypothetical protein